MNVRVFDGERPVDASAVRIDGAAVAELGGPRIAAPEDTLVDGRGAMLLPATSTNNRSRWSLAVASPSSPLCR